MLVFIDESGCAGFKIARGSDPTFGIGMVIFANGADARATEACISSLHIKLRHPNEFKFSKCRDEIRDGFFRAVATQPFKVRALLVTKESLRSPQLRGCPGAFYNYFIKELLR